PAMGAAAFHNEMINQVAEAYLGYRQKELNRRVKPDHYREELQKVKAYIAANNVYGVDINPTAIELGKLSLWLNGIHRDMETPFFANRLAVGNAVAGAWLKVYKEHEITLEKDNKGKEIYKEWWKNGPKPLSFGKKGILRRENEIYHFLLPDKNMLASAGIKMLKDEHEKEVERTPDWLKKFCKPFRREELNKLKQISDRIDAELKNYYRFIKQLNAQTHSRYNIFGALEEGGQHRMELRSYDEKEKLAQQRLKHDAAYYKLKLVMDYWCALWFWDVRDAKHLPNRIEYLDDLLKILETNLDENNPKGFTYQQKLLHHHGDQLTFDDRVEETARQTGAIIEQVDRSTFFDENERLKIVQRLSTRYKFFHPQLEFLEVFYERGGFDLICGNPPWIKVQFNEIEALADIHPELTIRGDSITKIRKEIDKYLHTEVQRKSYLDEQIELECISEFLSAKSNYNLLSGQKNNLYKCIINNSLMLVNALGFIGLLHEDGVYEDANGGKFRNYIYNRIKYHFEFKNSLFLFYDVHDQTNFSVNIYSGNGDSVSFYSIHNLFHPSTVDACFIHDGNGLCGGIKRQIIKDDRKGWTWNIEPHADRIIKFEKEELYTLAKTFEDGTNWASAKLVSIHSQQILSVLRKLSEFSHKVKNLTYEQSFGWDQTKEQDNGTISESTIWPNLDKYELIYNGSHIYVCNPFYKNPRAVCDNSAHFDEIHLENLSDNFLPRTNFVPNVEISTYRSKIEGITKNDYYLDHYKVFWRRRVGTASERTLASAIAPPKVGHLNSINSMIFDDYDHLIELNGLLSSVVIDFLIKTIGKSDVYCNDVSELPIGIDGKYLTELKLRVLLSNCLTVEYSNLWSNCWLEEYRKINWSISDARLLDFASLTKDWSKNCSLRNHFERRQALIEIDVIVAMALDLTIEELILIYEIQFSRLRQNEEDTWYDKKGNIVFTCNPGLSGVGLDRQTWNNIRDLKEGETYVNTVDPSKNELYGGQEVTYYAPFDKCDRMEDYKVAWELFEGVFGET
ncbi:hypothetical protein QLX67_12125, partial [Balneolaceae bacterium ANBcel3]|nr:hypothetical protein [Balneolaceae bacterium ANBcel3]